jgi:transposase
MPAAPLSGHKIRQLLLRYCAGHFNKAQTANQLKIARSTATKYLNAFKHSTLTLSDIEHAHRHKLVTLLFPSCKNSIRSDRKVALIDRFESVHLRIENDGLSVVDAWREEVASNRCTYKYSQFASVYAFWRQERGLKKRSTEKRETVSVKPVDLQKLTSWGRSCDRRRWETSVTLLGVASGRGVSELCRRIGRGRRTVQRWCRTYGTTGIDGLPFRRSRKLGEASREAITGKKNRLIKIIHEAPNIYSINRASWSLKALSDAYEKTYGERVSRSSISEYVIAEGYKFKKAKKSLTSNDPTYREKLTKITGILSRLSPDERFFSIDEFGPFSVKLRGGRALVPGDQTRTIPQRQKSKGSLICTAALELSANQITHFYSKKKNTKEMIKLLRRLIILHRNQRRIFLSWDSASWHASKALYAIVDEMNTDEFGKRHRTPLVELAPLPSGAQFLNVIESVFSGMSRAILHNSNYGSVQECKASIDLYFTERNREFQKHPRRAGKKIWGEERVSPVFREENNCKDPRWR